MIKALEDALLLYVLCIKIPMETTATYTIKETQWPEKAFLTIRAVKRFDALPQFFGESYGALYDALQKQGIKTCDMPCAFYYSIDEVKKETDMAAAVCVQGQFPEQGPFEKVILPPSRVISTTHYGPYESMMPAYQAMEQYLKEHQLKRTLVIEEYFSDPTVEKDQSKWKTNIHFVVQ